MPAIDPNTRFLFTEKRLKDWPVPKLGRVRLKDSKCFGLTSYLTASGTRTFYFYAKGSDDKKRPVEIRIGKMSVEAARDKAKEIAADPSSAAARRRAIREESTLAELWDWFEKHHVAHLRPATVRHYNDTWRLHVQPVLGAKQLSKIRRSDVQHLADQISNSSGNGAARHVCSVLSAMFHSAAKDDALQYRGDIPTSGVRRPKVSSRARFLQPGELPAFLEALAQEPPLWKLFWSCCLFVGLRRGNVASARWKDISMDLGQWLVPEERSKTGVFLAVPIPAPVLSMLQAWREELPAQLLAANESRKQLLNRGDAKIRVRLPVMTSAEIETASAYVFPSVLALGKPSAHPHITDPKSSWRRLLQRAGLEDLRPHDLRRSIGSWMALGGVGLPIIGAALGHKDQRSTAVYARLNDGAVRAAMERATQAMLIAGKTPAETVRTMPQ